MSKQAKTGYCIIAQWSLAEGGHRHGSFFAPTLRAAADAALANFQPEQRRKLGARIGRMLENPNRDEGHGRDSLSEGYEFHYWSDWVIIREAKVIE